MRRLFFTLLVALFAASCVSSEEAAVRGVIKRTFGQVPSNVEFEYVHSDDSCNFYSLQVEDDVLTVKGSSIVALCKGFHDYILENGYGIASWSCNRLDFPDKLEPMQEKVVRSPFEKHLFFNVCTFGYTAPFWDWERWEKEIDWLALHGFDMPLNPIAFEAISARVYRQLGLSEEEITQYFTGPAHLPWMRMGNISHIDGGMSAQWHENQIRLQHKMTGRMRELGMTPVIQGFAGFVPDAVAEHYPDRPYTCTSWHGLGATYLSPVDSLFGVIGTSFVKEWEKEFGKCDYYLMDSFNEMKLPFAPIGDPSRYADLKKYSECIYESLADANPDAVWVMQGWMFGRNRDIWEPRSVEALLSGAPKGKLAVVDLAVDYNHFEWRNGTSWDVFSGFFGTPWIWSTTPNFGGRSTFKGVLDFYLNEHITALNSPSKGNLFGHGSSPEGLENNEIIYELISSAGWSSEPKDLDTFLKNYSRARYGCDIEGVEDYWNGMKGSVYGEFASNDVLSLQRPPVVHYQSTMNINDNFFKAIEAFLRNSDEYASIETYKVDAIQNAAFYLIFKAEILIDKINRLISQGKYAQSQELQELVIQMLLEADRLLSSHPLYRLERWEDFARNSGTTQQESENFVREARRLVTSWGGTIGHDYAARLWSGLIRDYYVPRLKLYFESVADGRYVDMREYDKKFILVERTEVVPFENSLKAAVELVDKYSSLSVAADQEHFDFWNPQDLPSKEPVVVDYAIHSELVNGLAAIEFEGVQGSVRIKEVEIRNRWTSIQTFYPDFTVKAGQKKVMKVGFPPVVKGTAKIVYVKVTYADADNASGVIKYKY